MADSFRRCRLDFFFVQKTPEPQTNDGQVRICSRAWTRTKQSMSTSFRQSRMKEAKTALLCLVVFFAVKQFIVLCKVMQDGSLPVGLLENSIQGMCRHIINKDLLARNLSNGELYVISPATSVEQLIASTVHWTLFLHPIAKRTLSVPHANLVQRSWTIWMAHTINVANLANQRRKDGLDNDSSTYSNRRQRASARNVSGQTRRRGLMRLAMVQSLFVAWITLQPRPRLAVLMTPTV